MTGNKYKTEKRKANVGERILIIEDGFSLGYYEIGDVLTVSNTAEKGVTSEDDYFILNHEYEVIVGQHPQLPNLDEMDCDELIALSGAVMKAIKTRTYKLGYDQGRFDAEIEAPKSDQQKRDEIVKQAKEDVEYVVSRCSAARTEFIVNPEKRTVVSIRKMLRDGRVISKGITKCAPNDCFNAHIGKAIALRRALRLEVPTEYLNVPQPTEVRVGDVVETTFLNGEPLKFTVKRIENGRAYRNDVLGTYVRIDAGRRYGYPATDPKTIDDTRAGEGA